MYVNISVLSEPQQLQDQLTQSNDLILTWGAPENNSGEVTGYHISYSVIPLGIFATLNTTFTSVTLPLNPGTRYVINVYAMSRFGNSRSSFLETTIPVIGNQLYEFEGGRGGRGGWCMSVCNLIHFIYSSQCSHLCHHLPHRQQPLSELDTHLQQLQHTRRIHPHLPASLQHHRSHAPHPYLCGRP